MCIIQNFELFFLQTCFDKKKKKQEVYGKNLKYFKHHTIFF